MSSKRHTIPTKKTALCWGFALLLLTGSCTSDNGSGSSNPEEDGNSPPVAQDDSISTDVNSPVNIAVMDNDADSDSAIDPASIMIIDEPSHGNTEVNGNGSITYTPDTDYLGTDALSYIIADVEGAESNEASVRIAVGGFEEHIYYCPIYNGGSEKGIFLSTLSDIGAREENMNLWRYTDIRGKDFWIHIIEDIERMKEALKTEGAHIIIAGESNYGLGAVFATEKECNYKLIRDLRYIDDTRLLTYSSPVLSLNLELLRAQHAWPNFWPIFQNGEYGLMPYDFGDPAGDPAFNYYITYRIPGDPAFYKIETAQNSALERYPDADQPAWYDANGLLPNPLDPAEQQYFITHPGALWEPSFEVSGTWLQDDELPGWYDENYTYSSSGTVNDQFKWKFVIVRPGNYRIEAWWPASSENTSDALYIITHASGTAAVRQDQRSGGSQWNTLGQHYFNTGQYSVILRNNATSGRVVADAIRITDAITDFDFTGVLDNIEYPDTHYKSKTVIHVTDRDISKEELRYSRMVYDSCFSGNYYLDTFSHGIVFYTVSYTDGRGINPYLRAYLEGKSDREIWQAMQEYSPVYDYYNFNETPAKQ
ncbi:MAG: Ig-like domain-containing protein [Syntrophales bacterium]|jgi:hypothetical protein|nr:Ig-like domain-containing protein [Syntrophales bacterium]MDY0044451.1 Ig-like domain-containing protein [Syntrophales bacterium]